MELNNSVKVAVLYFNRLESCSKNKKLNRKWLKHTIISEKTINLENLCSWSAPWKQNLKNNKAYWKHLFSLQKFNEREGLFDILDSSFSDLLEKLTSKKGKYFARTGVN